jgi:arginine dihydrolase
MRLLLCPPSYYGIEYEINPWMSRDRQSDAERACRQWSDFRRLLAENLLAEIDTIDAKPGLPDMVFTANAGLVWQNKFIVSNFRHEVRRGESAHFGDWFRQRGFEIVHLSEDDCFEGEGDLLRCGDLWFAGYHIRSDINALQKVAEVIEREVLPLELTSGWFYHLDTCFCPLSAGAALYYPPAFDAYARKVLEHHIPVLVPVPAQEATRFACNAVVAGRNIVMDTGCPVVRGKVEELGFNIFETPLDEFRKAGGGAKCLTLIIG